MKSTIVYLHGYGSSPAGETATDFKKEFAASSVLIPHIAPNRIQFA